MKEKAKKSRNTKVKRYALIGLATVGGGALIGKQFKRNNHFHVFIPVEYVYRVTILACSLTLESIKTLY